MPLHPVYLDHNATTRPSPGVIEAMTRGTIELWANPSSVHRGGQNARAAIELARQQLAKLIGAKPRELILTSSCTEAIDLGVRGVLEASKKRVLVTSAVEHAAVREVSEDLERTGVEIRHLPVLAGGQYNTDAARELIDGTVGVVAVQWANNETGTIQPIRELGAICTQRGVPLLVDGAQWVGKMPTDLAADDLGIDLLAFSPHKFHGPKGVGVLWARAGGARGVRMRPRVLGSQELGRRGGTENVPGILGASVAADEAAAWLHDPANRDRVSALRDRLEQLILAECPEAVINRPEDHSLRLWNTTSIGFPGRQAEAILMPLSERGVFASAGAACSSGSLDPSPVLLAMGIRERVAHGSIRLSLGRGTTEGEIEHAAATIAQVVGASGLAAD